MNTGCRWVFPLREKLQPLLNFKFISSAEILRRIKISPPGAKGASLLADIFLSVNARTDSKFSKRCKIMAFVILISFFCRRFAGGSKVLLSCDTLHDYMIYFSFCVQFLLHFERC